MKENYVAPQVTSYGSIHALTGAIGGASINDQSDYPEQFPPDNGSYDVCNNSDPNTTC